MNIDNFEKSQGHWILAKMGKRVLRPGGKELTLKMIQALNINSNDVVAEFAPGLGFTTTITLQKKPKSFFAIEQNEEAVNLLKKKFNSNNVTILNGNASHTTLQNDSINKVYGEAMLTMHADHSKSEIIKEAFRILKSGGLYAIHELALTPDLIDDNVKTEIQKELALAIKVNARPLTEKEWILILENEGFTIKKIYNNSMTLLELSRIIDDEGLFRTIKIAFNVITQPKARKRIYEMRRIFRKYQNNMNAITVIAQKP